MKIEAVRQRLERHGDVFLEATDGDVVFRMEESMRGAQTVESLATTVDNIPRADLTVTGNGSSDALFLVRVPCDAFDAIPPYLEDEL